MFPTGYFATSFWAADYWPVGAALVTPPGATGYLALSTAAGYLVLRQTA